MAEQHPLVLVFEDLHWADDGLLDFVDHLAEWASGVPMLVLASARPELLDRRPNWGGGKLNAVTLALSPLDDIDSARVIAAVLDQAVLPGGDADGAARAGRRQSAVRRAVRSACTSSTATSACRRTCRESSRRVSTRCPRTRSNSCGMRPCSGRCSGWAGVSADDAAAALHALERKGFVRRERRSAVAGDTEYTFRHVLVREVAYGQIPRGARADKHVASVEWIESLGRPTITRS
jgi:predicted ATPase